MYALFIKQAAGIPGIPGIASYSAYGFQFKRISERMDFLKQ
jgi:hypothetical protein